MGDDLRNELSVFAFLILSTAVIVFILYWALKKFTPRK
jgi:hypothetical protein